MDLWLLADTLDLMTKPFWEVDYRQMLSPGWLAILTAMYGIWKAYKGAKSAAEKVKLFFDQVLPLIRDQVIPLLLAAKSSQQVATPLSTPPPTAPSQPPPPVNSPLPVPPQNP